MIQEILTITLSRLVRDDDTRGEVVSDEQVSLIDEALQSISTDGSVVVEVERGG